MSLDFSKVYRVKGFQGVACRIVGYPQRFEPYYFEEGGTDDNPTYYTEHGGEWVDDTDCGNVYVRMIGDDHRHTVHLADCTEIGELDYCSECGQLGCTHDGRDRG